MVVERIIYFQFPYHGMTMIMIIISKMNKIADEWNKNDDERIEINSKENKLREEDTKVITNLRFFIYIHVYLHFYRFL